MRKETIIIAGIQMHSEKGELSKNQEKAIRQIKKAVDKGAEFVLLPELFSCGYIPNKEIWQYAESDSGPTITFLKATSKAYGIYLGAGLLEKINGHHRNTYVITDPSGSIVGRAEKNNGEAYIFKRGNGKHIIDMPFGKIAVGICADNHYTEFIKTMAKEDIALIIMPHALPMPTKETKHITKQDIINAQQDIKEFAVLIASLLKIPTLFINQVGAFYQMVGIFGSMLKCDSYKIAGNSQLVNEKGEVLSKLNDNQEGFVIGEIALTNRPDKSVEVPNYDGWVQKGSKILRRVILPVDIFMGQIYYYLKKK